MKTLALFCATISLFAVSCQSTDKTALESLYDSKGVERVKVSKKNLASISNSDNIPIVKLTRTGASEVWRTLADVGLTLGKGVVTSYLDTQMERYKVKILK